MFIIFEGEEILFFSMHFFALEISENLFFHNRQNISPRHSGRGIIEAGVVLEGARIGPLGRIGDMHCKEGSDRRAHGGGEGKCRVAYTRRFICTPFFNWL